MAGSALRSNVQGAAKRLNPMHACSWPACLHQSTRQKKQTPPTPRSHPPNHPPRIAKRAAHKYAKRTRRDSRWKKKSNPQARHRSCPPPLTPIFNVEHTEPKMYRGFDLFYPLAYPLIDHLNIETPGDGGALKVIKGLTLSSIYCTRAGVRCPGDALSGEPTRCYPVRPITFLNPPHCHHMAHACCRSGVPSFFRSTQHGR